MIEDRLFCHGYWIVPAIIIGAGMWWLIIWMVV